MKKAKQRLSVLLLPMLIAVGCASTSQQEIAALRSMAEGAAADAAEAKRMAVEAEREAAAAKLAAEQARAQSAETESKIDRMFKKAMYK